MCGAVGLLPATTPLLDRLKRFGYRAYDSAGIATLMNWRIECFRAEGELKNLAAVLKRQPLTSIIDVE